MEEQAEYKTDNQYAAIIESPRMVKTLSEDGVIYSKAWGWVKTSAKFITHIKKLRGAKLAIWMTIALSIDEDGTCKLTIKELCEVTGYSHTEVIDSLKEMSAWGYLGINKDQRGNIYTPEFVARGENKPSETLVKKLDSTPAYQVESSPAEENADSSINRVKRVKPDFDLEQIAKSANIKVDAILDMANFPGAKKEVRINSILSYCAVTLHRTTTSKEWNEFARWIDDRQQNDGQSIEIFVKWLVGQKNYDPQYWPIKKMQEFWPQAFSVGITQKTGRRMERLDR